MSNITKIGIVIVSYNASEAVRVTLASVRRAYNAAAFKLILVDNASEQSERVKIQAAMSRHISEVGPAWRYIEQEKNLGFSGGNNIGISEFLTDEEISHICLLNSDVIVTDHWLDRLLAADADIISAVTNKADSEQCVPIDYHVELDECLDEVSEVIRDKVYHRISEFADRWHGAWKGNLVEADVTFFCVLLTKQACSDIGLLDEVFFPGGFEDDDYCLRARKAGYNIQLARDVYIHHWGSASFGQLQYEYFSTRAQRNKEYLEGKHGIVWQRRPEKPIVSFAMDIQFVLMNRDRIPLQKQFIELYLGKITNQINYFESEFYNLRNALASKTGFVVPETLAGQVKAAEIFGDLNAQWDDIAQRAKVLLTQGNNGSSITDSMVPDLEHIVIGIHDRVECNFAIHAFITTSNQPDNIATPDIPPPVAVAPVFATRPTTRFGKFLWVLRRGLEFILQFDGIVFFGGYFYPERQSDGYFQRIQIVDRMFANRWRVYVESDELRGRNIWFDRPEPKVLVLRIIGTKKRRMLVRLLALVAVLRSRKIYFHSVLRMYDNRFGRLLHLPFIRKAVDIHGVVPEEFRMHNDFFSAVLYEKEEKLAVEKAGIVIVVTDAMRQYFQQKFRDALKAKIVSFPIFPNFVPMLASRPLVDGKPIVVYAGGMHKWQQVPKMIDAIIRTADSCSHRFYCPEPQLVKAMLPTPVLDIVTVEAKTHAELLVLYPECHYGFILREDIIVNRAACPTKLVEYLAMGIVPIVDSEDIGDFKALGMRVIHLNDFLAGRLPGEAQRAEMAALNFGVYERLKEVRHAGATEIHTFLTSDSRAGVSSLLEWFRRILPPETLVGRMARRIWRTFSSEALTSMSSASANTFQASVLADDKSKCLSPCDILVQVDNFEAGGLENVVIDLNNTLSRAGYRVVLLVLGTQGVAVKTALDLGQTVVCCSYSQDSHAALLDQLQPKLILAHYSFRGVALYHQKAIPFVQVVHNIYMWFNEHQRREFAETAAMTTAFVAVSDHVRSYSISRLGVAPEKCTVIPNGIDFEPFNTVDSCGARARLRAKYGMADDEFVFLDVGAINHQKNHLGVVKAFEIAAQVCTNARLVILGPCYEPVLLQEILAYVEIQGLQGKVLYCESAPSAHEHMLMSDTFVSATFFEGGPLTLLEAIAANIPVIMPAVGCASHFVGRKGIQLVEPVYDMIHFSGQIWEMKSTPAFEQRLADAMVSTWLNPARPDFSATELAMFEKGRAYESYIRLITEIITKGESVLEENSSALGLV
ncbi:GT2 family glycosyltransferase/glycosyltransferase involved in cell wall biosynthesis [Chitinivorax tropicus]|uniref:GT2 family glycosyltransferase/glycosyltransferase involved in cell wall biosynthesis n=1 Tax=Chitinivorax tropicus TaxID=714531 RepID=A0A840MUP4_9PROT|nr:glycosyltransferase [Chitinivorax tropicus]MBB5020522.1 GT2 family glycosyltransferase/glycosyltransferase involved in cell wall biosynthesis [Chitinivorax tropicus]